ncbi:hypothetical protein KQI52_06800 [bacterium]|nr:hypothetical protein [bacterium]
MNQEQKPSLAHRMLMIALFSVTIASVVLIAVQGWDYYTADRLDRPHLELHEAWKAGGVIGHGLGIIGSLLMLLLLLYIPRKNSRRLQNVGKLSHWLNVHIWMGITGPLLITFHSTFKFGGIVAVSYWSMVAVALSGVLGRYIYLQIPRTLSGQELSEQELDSLDSSLQNEMRSLPGMTDELVAEITRTMSGGRKGKSHGFGAVFSWIGQDLLRPIRVRALRSKIASETELASAHIRDMVSLARKRALLIRRRAFLNVARKTLHHWHVIHRPFALVMFIIMFVHIAVAVLFGYTWVW